MTAQLRVVAFTPGHTEVGGAARRSRLLCEELARRGADVRVVTRSGTARSFAVRRERGLVVVEIPRLGGRRRGAAAFLSVAFALGVWWGRRADVLLSVQLVSPTTAAALVGGVTRRPFIAMTTTSGALREVDYLATKSWTDRLRRRVLRRAARIVVQTTAGAAELQVLIPNDRIAVLPTPVAAVRVAPISGGASVLYAGRFSVEKNLGLLLAAWKDVMAVRPDARLVLAGGGGDYRSVEDELRTTIAASRVLRESVVLAGWVTDVSALLAEHDIYVFPSSSEGMSNSLVEACAAGRAVVASDIAPNVAVLGADYPLLFPVGNRQALVKALLDVLNDEDLRRRAAATAGARAKEMALSEVGRRLEGLLREVAADARVPR